MRTSAHGSVLAGAVLGSVGGDEHGDWDADGLFLDAGSEPTSLHSFSSLPHLTSIQVEKWFLLYDRTTAAKERVCFLILSISLYLLAS